MLYAEMYPLTTGECCISTSLFRVRVHVQALTLSAYIHTYIRMIHTACQPKQNKQCAICYILSVLNSTQYRGQTVRSTHGSAVASAEPYFHLGRAKEHCTERHNEGCAHTCTQEGSSRPRRGRLLTLLKLRLCLRYL